MSYSFSVTADTKEEAKQKIADRMDEVVTGQPNHAADRDAAVTVGQALVDTLYDPEEDEEILVNMSGYLSWTYEDPTEFSGASVNVSVAVRIKS
jgi:hypothetical protein